MGTRDSDAPLGSRLHVGKAHPAALIGVIVIAAVVVICVIGGLLNANASSSFQVIKADEEIIEEPDNTNAQDGSVDNSGTTAAQICIHVSGCVTNPGIYYLDEGARVVDAVDASGGFTEQAAPDAVNLARELTDGEHIVILSIDEATETANTMEGTADVSPDPAVQSGTSTGSKININKADSTQLQTLSGIGEVTAGKIVDYREEHGPFSTIEDIKQVSGIGDKKFDAIKDSICVG